MNMTMKKVTFEINANELEKFHVLETIALSSDESMMKFLSEFVAKMDSRKRKLTEEEWYQRADWMGLEPEEVTR